MYQLTQRFVPALGKEAEVQDILIDGTQHRSPYDLRPRGTWMTQA